MSLWCCSTEVQGTAMYRMILYRMILTAVAALAAATLPRPAAAVDLPIMCADERGDATIAACSPVLALRPNSGAGGRAFIDKDGYGRTVSDHDPAIGLDPKFTVANNNRGDACRHNDDHDRAAAAADEAIRPGRDPAATAGNTCAEAYQGANDPDPAIGGFDRPQRRDPSLDDARARRVQGLLAQRSFAPPSSAPSADIFECTNAGDDVARRLDACTRAIAANPGNNRVVLPAYLARASLYQKLKQWDRVVADCDAALRIGPPVEMRATTEGLRRAALAIMQQSNPGAQTRAPGGAAAVGQGTGGNTGWGAAASHQPLQPGPGLTTTASPSPLSGDISECANLGDDVARRLDACTRAIAANPGNNRVLLPAYMARASLYQKLKQWDRVVADCDEALRIGPPVEMRATTEGLRRAALAILERRNPGAPPDPASSPAPSTTQSADLARCIDPAGKDVPRRLDACTRAIDANPGNNDVLAAHMARALLYQGLKQWDRVIADCDEVLRLAPEGEMRSAADILRGVAVAMPQSNPGGQANVPAQSSKSSADLAACANRNMKDEAIAACNRLLALNPKDAAAYRNRGGAYSLKGDHDQAIADYDQALRLDPKFAGTGTQFGLAVTYYGRAVAYNGKFDFDHALANLDQAIRLDPKNVLFYTSRGTTYGNQGDYERAIADFDQAMRLDPKNAQHPNWGASFLGVAAVAYDHRGEAYEAKNDPDRAIADFEQALKFDPSLASARRGRERMATLLAQRSKPQPTTDLEKCKKEDDELPRRVEACNRTIEANSGSKTELILAYIMRASLYARLRQWDRVVADADAALRLNPPAAFSAPLYGLRGGALRQLHEYDRALADFDNSISPSNPLLADDYWGRGYVYLNMANYERARADLDKSISLKPSTTAYRIRAEWRLERGDNAGALADVNEGLRLDPQDADCYAVRAEYYVRMGKLKEAQTDSDKALGIRPESSMVHATRGWIALEQGRIEVALGELTEAIDLEPGPASVAHRGMAYERSGRADRAIADYRRALEITPSSRMGREAQENARQRIAALANVPATTPAVSVPAAPPGRRIALVIGMGAYANVGTLRNPTSDARAIADEFRRLGFAEVIEREDLTRTNLEEALKEFGDKAAEADWAIIYYAGHGIEMNGENYLVPVDAKITRAEHVEDEAVTLKRVLAKTEAAHKLRMVILDACRNNPFRMADAGSRGIGRGLLPVEPARGVMVAYAARDGTTADDGNSGHSPYTQALLANLETPGIDIRILFSKVRDQVLARTNNNQEPFTYGSLPGEEFYFKEATR